jgi:hypothetical protein
MYSIDPIHPTCWSLRLCRIPNKLGFYPIYHVSNTLETFAVQRRIELPCQLKSSRNVRFLQKKFDSVIFE